MKASGFVADALKRSGQVAQVAPAGEVGARRRRCNRTGGWRVVSPGKGIPGDCHAPCAVRFCHPPPLLIAFGTLAHRRPRRGQRQQNAAPKAETGQSAAPRKPRQENRKTSGSNDQSGPSNAAPTASQDGQGDKATHSTAGRAGTEEPGSHAPSQDTAVFVNGALNVPGAPADSQTVPAKFSKRNDAIDRVPIMAMPVLAFSDEQKRSIVDARARREPAGAIDQRQARRGTADRTSRCRTGRRRPAIRRSPR